MNDINVRNFLYFDIETVGKYKDVFDMQQDDPKLYSLLEKKFSNKGDKERWDIGENGDINDLYLRMSPIIPEYGKIVCITFGSVNENDEWKVKSFVGDEETILKNTAKMFMKASEKNIMPCGYNVILFDLPFINKKMIKYGIRIPYNILLFDKKPWNIKVFDLCESWKSTGRYWSSLDEVTHELGVESPKENLSGDKVHYTYWIENDIDKIQKYCEKDVKALKDVVEKMAISFN